MRHINERVFLPTKSRLNNGTHLQITAVALDNLRYATASHNSPEQQGRFKIRLVTHVVEHQGRDAQIQGFDHCLAGFRSGYGNLDQIEVRAVWNAFRPCRKAPLFLH